MVCYSVEHRTRKYIKENILYYINKYKIKKKIYYINKYEI